jgi:D-alanyl-D-alanine carboxypeptidase
MTIPVVIGFFVVSMLANFFSPSGNIQPAAASGSLRAGAVLGAVEQIYNLPEETYAYFYPEHTLPSSDDKKIIPARKPEAANLFISASSSLVIDKESGEILWQEDPDSPRPIASITKLMTALVFLETQPDWEKIYQLKKEDSRNGGKSYIYTGDEVMIKDLFYLMLVGSDNTAAAALVASTGITEKDFVGLMNAKARVLGLAKTHFEEISGLDGRNISTANEVALLAKKCLAVKKIRETSAEAAHEFSTAGGRQVKVDSTDYLLSAFPQNGVNIVGGKTGHIETSGYCFVGEFKNHEGREVISAVLGAPSDESRFAETKKLVRWVYDSYNWQ